MGFDSNCLDCVFENYILRNRPGDNEHLKLWNLYVEFTDPTISILELPKFEPMTPVLEAVQLSTILFDFFPLLFKF